MVFAKPYVSIDIGAKNLAICEGSLLNGDIHITAWRHIVFEKATMEQSVRSILAYLNDSYEVIEVGTTVLIERQVMYNIKAVAISYAIMAFFTAKDIKVEFCSATIKPLSKTGKKRKRDAVQVVQDLLKDTRWYDHFLKHGKRDDLADAYLQLIGYTRAHPVH